MKIKMLFDSRLFFAKGSVVEVSEREAARLLSLGFAEKVAEEKKAVEKKEVAEEVTEEKKETKKSRKKKEEV